MAQNRWPAGEINIYQSMPGLQREVYQQRAQCCWAIAVGTAVSYTCSIAMDAVEEASPQDIWDRVWYYSTNEQRDRRQQDARGGFPCNNSVAYRYVNAKGASLLRNCPFENHLNRDRGPVRRTEFPRIYCGQYQKLDLGQAVNAILRNVAVTAAVEVTDALIEYQGGIYRKTAGDRKEGVHSVVIVGVNVEQRYFRIRNSWGVNWGDRGYGLIGFDDLDRFTCADSAWKEDHASELSDYI